MRFQIISAVALLAIATGEPSAIATDEPSDPAHELVLNMLNDAYAEDPLAHHPDGTPINPRKYREMLQQAASKGAVLSDKLMEAAQTDDLQATIDAVKHQNVQLMFEPDGAATHLEQWREHFKNDAVFASRIKQHDPAAYETMMTGTDDQVQAYLRSKKPFGTGWASNIELDNEDTDEAQVGAGKP
uniref:RxLR effector protein n=1 Tax=Haptolina brevifila TaxID=156173 RepID=A0A6U7K3D9_9EUKA|mmetsp:Transcript_65707/g.130144  ORF Transcript_65707/g.130144 Transcript_65707/m.130144 type:complete len:186 (+) Transcript_65707:66-623(+)|eukprot:CAMPEP_0174716318 /NCGR_PEP_ID=MMETSP1094-20130205/23703_1 /TAXON_ID=156173 /ORGANISM="Chrysochromulina brevifilum, Strain UTEX LB 985" /LENGTH=185 /DNA_ID=CAMNT_0015916035 /DNA_START=64 /DNA_END=621 /DNA_ORIENTATION=-